MSFYAKLLSDSIYQSGMKLTEISESIFKLTGKLPTHNYLSRLKNGKTPPAGDKLNDALAETLGIDPIELKVAAYKEKIPPEILIRLNQRDVS